jgi:hypothetical protein
MMQLGKLSIDKPCISAKLEDTNERDAPVSNNTFIEIEFTGKVPRTTSTDC